MDVIHVHIIAKSRNKLHKKRLHERLLLLLLLFMYNFT